MSPSSPSAQTTEFNAEYFVTGHNIVTNERVVGYLYGVLGDENVGGLIYDRGDKWTVVGKFSGKGTFILRSLCCEYETMVVPEVSPNKLHNRNNTN